MSTAVATKTREHLAIALDVDDLVEARRLARELQPYFGVAKVGLELFAAVGPDIVGIIADHGYKVFLDLKMLDIPATVGRAAQVVGSIGASYLTLHAFGGAPMLRAGVDGLNEGAARAGLDSPVAVAVTILTSDRDAPPHILGNRVRTAVEGGCGGIVCAAEDVREAKQLAPRLLAVVPGVRPTGNIVTDDERSSTAQYAISAGADLLIVGRAVTGAENRAQAAEEFVENLVRSGQIA